MTGEADNPLPAPSPPGGLRTGPFLPGVALIAMVFAVYMPALRAGFVWDDDHHFTENPLMTEPGGLLRIWTEHRFYYPLTSTAWYGMRRVFGLDPLPYHALNILLHGLNAALFWRLLRRLAIPGAWLAAAAFALHPVNVQSVAWATELKNCLSGAFYLASLLAWTCFRDEANPANRRRAYYLFSLGSFILALASKTSAVVLPLTLIFADLWRSRKPASRLAAGWLPFFALAGIAGGLTLSGHRSMVEGPEWDLSFGRRFLLAAECVRFYLVKLAVPVKLAFVYPRWDAADSSRWIGYAALGSIAGMLAVARKAPLARATLLAFGCFVAGLLPILNFFRMYYARYSYVADHWQYLACMPAFAWAAGCAAHFAAGRRARPARNILHLLAAGSLLLLGSATWKQSQAYESSETLWIDVLSKNPRAEIAYNNLGAWYFDHGQPKLAEGILRKGLALFPSDIELQTILAAVLLGENRFEEARALMTEALARSPDDPEILNNLGLAEWHSGELAAAIGHFRKAVAADPGYARIQVNCIQALIAAGRRDEARAALQAAEKASPGAAVWPQLRAVLRD